MIRTVDQEKREHLACATLLLSVTDVKRSAHSRVGSGLATIRPFRIGHPHVITKPGGEPWMLELGPDGATSFIPQLDDLTARSSCSWCPSIEFGVPMESPYIPQPLGFRICCSGNSDGYDVGLMLTAGSGDLSQLEVYTFGEIDHPFSLRALQTLAVTI